MDTETFKAAYLQIKVETLKNLIEDFKKAVDKCDVKSMVSTAMLIGSAEEFLAGRDEKPYLTAKQEEEIQNCKRNYNLQFQRLSSLSVNFK
jgi:hypothetical protein